MRIGQLAQIAGIDTQTIRFYEQQGLLPPPERQENGYRVYTEKHGEWLAFIRRCRILDLSLTEIRELQSYQDDPRQPCMRIPHHPATQSTLIWPGIPRPSGHLFHGHPAGQSERSDAGVALLVRVGWRRQFLRPFAH